jgi:hypothetical protein
MSGVTIIVVTAAFVVGVAITAATTVATVVFSVVPEELSEVRLYVSPRARPPLLHVLRVLAQQRLPLSRAQPVSHLRQECVECVFIYIQ